MRTAGTRSGFIDEHKINYRVMVGNDDVAQLYGATSLPTTLIIDRSGRIAATHAGLPERASTRLTFARFSANNETRKETRKGLQGAAR